MYYALALDLTMLPAISTIASTQSKASEETQAAVAWLLDYAATHTAAKIQ